MTRARMGGGLRFRGKGRRWQRRKRKEEVREEEQGKQKPPRLGNALEDKPELAWWDWRKKLQRNGHRSKDNNHGHVSHQDRLSKEQHRERRQCFPSPAPLPPAAGYSTRP